MLAARLAILICAPAATVAALATSSPAAVPYVPCHKPRPTAAAASALAAPASTVRWSFRGSGGGSVTSGHGSYDGPSRISGSACHNDAGASGRRLTLAAVPGQSASLARGITIGGTLGAQLVLPVRVAASDDLTCVRGARGTLTIFTSYNGTHADRVSLRMSGACARHSASYRGAAVVVSIPH